MQKKVRVNGNPAGMKPKFEPGEVPIFDDEVAEASAPGFTESAHPNCLAFEKAGMLVVRYQDPNGIDKGNRIYHVYAKEVDAEGNFTGNAKALESINGEPMPYTLKAAFDKANNGTKKPDKV